MLFYDILSSVPSFNSAYGWNFVVGLLSGEQVVSVVYYRAGYTPNDYPSENVSVILKAI